MLITLLVFSRLAVAQFIDVRDFGVNMSDTLDDTEAFQAALNQGGDILIPPGVAYLTNALQVSAGTILIGSGSAASELRWRSPAVSGGLSGTQMTISGLGLRTMVPLASSAVYCSCGPLFADNLWIQNGASGYWTDGMVLEDCTNSYLASIRQNGVTNQTHSALSYRGLCRDGLVEDFHSRNSGYGILIDGDCSGLEMRRVSLIGCLYGIYIDPDNVASNVAVYDFDTSCSRGCLWINNTVDSVFCGGYAGLSGWDNPLYEGAVTINGANSINIKLFGIRMQNNYAVLNTSRGLLLKQCEDLNVCAMNIRGMRWGVVALPYAQAVQMDGVGIHSDVQTPWVIQSGSDIDVIPYISLQ